MMLGDDAVSALYKFIFDNSKDIGVDKKYIFKYERPKKMVVSEYIVLNHLPFVRRDTIEEGVINVNIHVLRTASDEPNTKRLKTIVKNLLDVVGPDKYLGGAYFDFYCDSRPTIDNDNTYYINLKVNVTYNTLKE